jgi:hypothetical protein
MPKFHDRDNSFRQATEASATGEFDATSTLGSFTDLDVFKFNLAEGQNVQLHSFGTADGGGQLDTVLYLYDAAGQIVSFNDDNPQGSLDSYISYTAPTAGTYYAVVSAYDYLPDTSQNSVIRGRTPTGPIYTGDAYQTGSYELDILYG